MLALFKPWRNGSDLKSESESWHEAFSRHNFSARELQLMDNFNLRYECLDQRDDFHAQLRKNDGSGMIFLSWDDHVSETMGDDYFPDLKLKNFNEETMEQVLASQGHTNINILQQMKEMCDILQGAHWTRESTDIPPIASLPHPDRILSGVQWETEIQSKKNELLECQMRSLPGSDQTPGNKRSCFKPNEVRVVDKNYLEQHYHSEEFKASLDSSSYKFSLNKEQDQAFRIVANHAVSPYSNQLNLYIGGIGGTGKSQVLKALMNIFNDREETH